MGTIRNKMVIVHHYNLENIEKIRCDAVRHFQEAINKEGYALDYDVNTNMISSILTSFTNGEYSFVIMGDCSKLGWETSNNFNKIRNEWISRWENSEDLYKIILVDFGEDYDASVEEL